MNFEVPLAQLVGFILAGTRIGVWLMVAPPFSHRAISARTKIMLAMALAFVMRPDVDAALMTTGVVEAKLITLAAQEAFIGAALGFLCLLVYLVMQAAGNMVDMLGGFMMAFSFDLQLGGGMAPMGRFYHLTALAILFASNAHLLILRGVLRTFELVPVGENLSLSAFATMITDNADVFMMSAIQIAGPLVAVLFLTDVGLGLLTRIAPQLNVLMLMFPLKIAITMALVALGFAGMPGIMVGLTERVLSLMAQLVRVG